MKIKKYITVGGHDAFSLDDAVNEQIQDGYEPFGNPYILTHAEKDPVFFQAMVLVEQKAG